MGNTDKVKKAKGSDSERKLLEHAHRGLELMAEYRPKLIGKVQAFMAEAMRSDATDKKTKEMITLGMALVQNCPYCIGLHIRSCKSAGVTLEEIMDVCSLAIMMGGGPTLTHTAEVERALNEFYLDEEGEPIE